MAQVDSEDSIAATTGDGTPHRRTDISPEQFFQILGRLRRAAREEIERLITFLDQSIDCDEDASVDDAPLADDSELEQSLGSLDRMSNQINAWRSYGGFSGDDTEKETDSGIGDFDGLLEQCPRRSSHIPMWE